MNRKVWILIILLVALSAAPIVYKTVILGISFIPRVDKNLWTVEFTTKIKASPRVRRIGFPVPRPSDRVFIRDTQFDGKGMALTISRDPDGYVGHWRGRAAWDRTAYFKVILETVEKEYPQPGDDFTAAYSSKYTRYLAPSDLNAQELEDLSRIEKDIIPDTKNKTKLARAIYYFVYEEVLYNGNKRHTPIGQVLETLEASSWGKSKLFTVLCRRQGIPARMVGGIILRPQQEEEAKGKRKFFFWNEAYLDGKWKPVCATYGNFARLTAEYLPLFWDVESASDIVGDKDAKLTVHANKVESTEFTIHEYRNELHQANSWLLEYSLYMLPLRLQMLLKTLLLIPLGAVVLTFFRNIIGFKTFGIFMPVLLALFFMETSFLFGVGFFGVLVLLGAIERYYLEKLHLLAVPRLSIILTLVVIFLCVFSVLNQSSRLFHNFTPALFPIVITTIFIERFNLMLVEEGIENTARALAGTLVISLICYALFSVRMLQVIIFTYPEVLFTFIAVFILIGSYNGYRLSEFLRFRELLKRR